LGQIDDTARRLPKNPRLAGHVVEEGREKVGDQESLGTEKKRSGREKTTPGEDAPSLSQRSD